MAKTKVEIRTEVKDTIAQQIVAAIPTAVQIDDYIYAVPMGTAEDNGNPLYAKIEISAPNWYATKKTDAFDVNVKVAAYNHELCERVRKAQEKAQKAVEKEAARQSKSE